MKHALKRRKYITGAEKIHTSIYLLPRHHTHLQFLMNVNGWSMTNVVAHLIEKSIKLYKTGKTDGYFNNRD